MGLHGAFQILEDKAFSRPNVPSSGGVSLASVRILKHRSELTVHLEAPPQGSSKAWRGFVF